jgi:hypothetical protein
MTNTSILAAHYDADLALADELVEAVGQLRSYTVKDQAALGVSAWKFRRAGAEFQGERVSKRTLTRRAVYVLRISPNTTLAGWKLLRENITPITEEN